MPSSNQILVISKVVELNSPPIYMVLATNQRADIALLFLKIRCNTILGPRGVAIGCANASSSCQSRTISLTAESTSCNGECGRASRKEVVIPRTVYEDLDTNKASKL
jgi:hypothetical protein